MKRLLCVVLLLLVLVVPPAVAAPDAPMATNVFINEIHYDNTGTDSGEKIEVAAPSGTNLTGWTIVLYNGTGGVTYDTDPVGAVAGSCGSYDLYVITYAVNGIQNGAPDGLALVNASNAVIQFLSYEGPFTATNGPAAGMTSTDMGVSENGTGAVGNSLQLSGTGTMDLDFTWQSEAANTFGACNTGQTFGGATDSTPQVSSTTPANGAPNVAMDANVIVVFSENVTVTGEWFQIICPTSGTRAVADTAVTGGPQSFTINPMTVFAFGETCSVTVFAGQVTDQDGAPDNMAANYSWSFTIPAAGFTKIHDIQGSGSTATPGTFTVEATVTGDYQGVTGVDDFKLDGFFIQEEDADADANPASSEGIFVFCQTCPTNVIVGDKVQVTGTSSEYFDMSQLNATTAGSVVVVSGGNALPAPAAITLPVPGVTATDLAGARTQINAYYEPFEGMLVQMGAQLSVTEYFELFRYGQLVLAQGGRFRQFTDGNAPSATGYTAHQIDLARRKVILDDDSNQQNHALAENPDIPVFHPTPGGFSTTNYVRGGDTITDLTGVLHWSFAGQTGTDAWRIRPVVTNPPTFSYTFTPANLRTSAPVAVGGNLQAGSFNTLNFFTTISTTACGPTGGQDCRGADSSSEFTRQRDKLVAAICAMDADVLGLMELENLNPANDPAPGDGIADYVLKDLVNAINASGSSCPDKTYTFTDSTAAGTDAIRVGIIYKTSSVTPIGLPLALTSSGFTDPNNTGTPKSRPALAQTFEENTWGERFTIVANHLKSKGSCPTTTPLLDTDQNDGQGCWNDTRQKAASYLVNTWLPTHPTASDDPDFLVVGDLNAYRLEAPITNITGAGYTDLINSYAGGSAYGYLFDGQLGYLDHALSAATLTPQVTGATEWHINADEVNLLDYNDTVQDPSEATFDAKPTATSLYNADAYRSTDHDPVLVGLGLYPDSSDLAAYGVAWHTGQGTLWRLGTTWTGEPSSGTGTDVDDGVIRDYGQDWNDGGGEVNVTVTGPATQWACLNAWLDYSNGVVVPNTVETPDGQFNLNEHVVNNLPIQAGVNQIVTWPLEPGVIDGAAQYNMRFRLVPAPDPAVQSCSGATLASAPAALTPNGGASPTGRADGGEVEDHSWIGNPTAVTLSSFAAAGVVGAGWPTAAGLGALGFILLACRRRR